VGRIWASEKLIWGLVALWLPLSAAFVGEPSSFVGHVADREGKSAEGSGIYRPG